MTNLLIVDGERCMRNTLKERLEYEGYRIDTAENGEEALSKIGQKTYQLVLADLLITSPGVSDLLEALSHSTPNPTPLIVLSSLKGIEPAIDCIRHGAFDYLAKPVNLNKLLESIRAALEAKNQNRATMEHSACESEKLSTLSSVIASPRRPNPLRDELIGTSAAMIHVQRLVEKVATSDARVLIIGENGTGKELVARQLHAKSLRCEEAFVEVNCAAIPSELIESELFGHEKGSFTSANKQHKGKFEQADGGTLFLDEIGDMSLSAQAKVLRALQENRISRVGSDRDITVNVRVVAATNKNLLAEIAAGNFREDLYHRLSVIIIRIPPLRERKEDIPLLTHYFVERISAEYGIAEKLIEPEALDALCGMTWSGNIRELRNVIERLIILSDTHITVQDIEAYASGKTL